MGKKSRREREERRESFAAKRIKQKRKNSIIIFAVFAVIITIIGISSYNFITSGGIGQGSPENAGTLGDEHVHASILTKIHGDSFDYSLPAYQIKSGWIHFEAQDGTTIHRHASGVTLEYLFNSVGIRLDEKCFVFPDYREFCTNEEFSLQYYVNGDIVNSINDLVIEDESRILISYGKDDSNRIAEELAELEGQEILG
ncbi:MAG: putative membrane protein [Cenarchaeum symbiont of Oopsacas minuta]|nr:putative membrane protein [Cenarchaeum symbiont of Oopsacas minuta]